MMRKSKSYIKGIIIAIFCSMAYSLSAQSDVKIEIQLVSPDVLGEKCMDNEEFFKWVKVLNDDFNKLMKEVPGNHEGLLLVNLNDKNSSDFSLSFKPPIDETLRLKLLNELAELDTFRTNFAEYTFFLKAIVNEGSKRKGHNYYPPVIFPREARLNALREMTLEQKTIAIKSWIDQDVIPSLAYFENNVDSKFEGVRWVGNAMSNKTFQNSYTNDYLDSTYMYWRAILEMTKGNQLIPVSRICMHMSNEEWDIAMNYVKITKVFNDNKSLAAFYLQEIEDQLKILNQHVNMEVEKGIKLHDEGKYTKALEVYNQVFKKAPLTAYVNYERYLSESTIELLKDSTNKKGHREVWDKYRPVIYAANPLYGSMAQAKNGDEGFELVCRSMLGNLFKDGSKTKTDMLAYADLAIELEDYGFAAHIYWWLYTFLGNDAYPDRKLINDFLYALHQQGDTEVIKNFEGDFKEAFKAIDDRRKFVKEADTMYQAFETKSDD